MTSFRTIRYIPTLIIIITTFLQFKGLGQEQIVSDSNIIIDRKTDSLPLTSKDNIEFSKNDSSKIPSTEKESGRINLYILIPFLASIITILLALWKLKPIFLRKEKRYLKEIIKKYHDYEKYIELDVSILSNEDDLSKDKIEKRAISLNNLINSRRSVQIIGPPGSGKTSILYKLLLSHSKSKLSDKKKQIPVFLEFRGRDVFERIREFLHINQFTKDITVINEKWLRKKLIAGKFLFLIDDVHKLIDAKSLEEQTKIRELLDYNKNQFVLMSRDFIKVSRFGLELFQIAQLNENQIINILKMYSDEQEAHIIYQNFRWDKKLIELYSTPQMLMFLSTIFKKYNSIPSNKSQIFTEYLEIKKMKEFNQDVEAINKFENI